MGSEATYIVDDFIKWDPKFKIGIPVIDEQVRYVLIFADRPEPSDTVRSHLFAQRRHIFRTKKN